MRFNPFLEGLLCTASAILISIDSLAPLFKALCCVQPSAWVAVDPVQ